MDREIVVALFTSETSSKLTRTWGSEENVWTVFPVYIFIQVLYNETKRLEGNLPGIDSSGLFPTSLCYRCVGGKIAADLGKAMLMVIYFLLCQPLFM